MLAIAALPFVVLFPEPPAFGRPAAGLGAAFVVLAPVGTAYRAGPEQRARLVRRAATVLPSPQSHSRPGVGKNRLPRRLVYVRA